MRVITIVNPKILGVPYTTLSQDYSSGTTLTVEDSTNFADNDLILIGGRGNEQAEIVDLTASPPTAGTMTITAMNFAHASDESVQKSLWDQYDLQVATSEGGEWSNVVTGAVFDWGSDSTEYVHTAGEAGYYYRSRYLNSALATESSWSDSVVGTGLTRLQVGALIGRVRKKAKEETASSTTDKEIIASFNAVNDIVKGLNRRWWFLKTEYEFLTEADTRAYDLPSDYERAYRLKYNFNDGTENIEYYLRFTSLTQFEYEYRNLDADSSDDLVHYSMDDINSQAVIGPSPLTAGYTLTLVYFQEIVDVNSYGDTVQIPLADLYVHYATAEVWENKDNEKKAQYHKGEFSNMLEVLEQMRNKTPTPKEMKTWRGRKAMQRMYGSRRVYSDADREKYW